MKAKEAIEILEIEIKLLGEEIEICNPNDDIDAQIIPANKKFIIEYNEIIELLQQGEKHRLILKDLDRQYGHYLIGVKGNGEIGIGYTIRDLMDISYNKYFPKEVRPNLPDFPEGDE